MVRGGGRRKEREDGRMKVRMPREGEENKGRKEE